MIGKKFSLNRGNGLPARPMKTTWELAPGILRKGNTYKIYNLYVIQISVHAATFRLSAMGSIGGTSNNYCVVQCSWSRYSQGNESSDILMPLHVWPPSSDIALLRAYKILRPPRLSTFASYIYFGAFANGPLLHLSKVCAEHES